MGPTATAIIIVLVIIVLAVIGTAAAAFFREDLRMILYSRFLNPILILAGKDYMVRSGTEKEIYTLIRQYPGIGYGSLLKDLGIDDATLSFQLSRLLRENLVSQVNENGRLSLVPNYVTRESSASLGLPPLSPLERSILENLRRLGPAARIEIGTTLKVPSHTVRHALDLLKKRGLVGFDGEDEWSYCWAESYQPRIK